MYIHQAKRIYFLHIPKKPFSFVLHMTSPTIQPVLLLVRHSHPSPSRKISCLFCSNITSQNNSKFPTPFSPPFSNHLTIIPFQLLLILARCAFTVLRKRSESLYKSSIQVLCFLPPQPLFSQKQLINPILKLAPFFLKFSTVHHLLSSSSISDVLPKIAPFSIFKSPKVSLFHYFNLSLKSF